MDMENFAYNQNDCLHSIYSTKTKQTNKTKQNKTSIIDFYVKICHCTLCGLHRLDNNGKEASQEFWTQDPHPSRVAKSTNDNCTIYSFCNWIFNLCQEKEKKTSAQIDIVNQFSENFDAYSEI